MAPPSPRGRRPRTAGHTTTPCPTSPLTTPPANQPTSMAPAPLAASASGALEAGAGTDVVGDDVVALTAEQAAALLQVRPSWLRRKAAARAIPCRYLGKHLRFTRDDIVAIAAQAAPRGTSARRSHRGRPDVPHR
jgi:hypothetical protein